MSPQLLMSPNVTSPPQHQIFLTPILSKVFERLVSVRLGRFMEGRGVLPTIQFAYIGKVLALVMSFFVWHTPYRVLWRWGRRLE